MKPQDFLRVQDRQKDVDKAEEELKKAKEQVAQIEQIDPGTPEEWESLSLGERAENLYERIKVYTNEACYETDTLFEGDTDYRIIQIEHEGHQKQVALCLTLGKQDGGIFIAARWVQGSQKEDDEPFVRDESIARLVRSGFDNLGEEPAERIKIQLNNLYQSFQAYKTAKEVLTS